MKKEAIELIDQLIDAHTNLTDMIHRGVDHTDKVQAIALAFDMEPLEDKIEEIKKKLEKI